ncbi:XRE family transcriptional regulator [Rhizobium sullae]|uniref:XRE family transcriptional regulator n=2 Tax=Rhizobium sullae TaxID=50338 RepID=A0A2N0DGP7_RHISU|nr:XRE family transcriptional regulator [Rhizobium sullae]
MNRIGIAMGSESETLLEIGRLLRRARLSSALTQEQVADLAGISRPRYRDIETGTAAARVTTLINIARALGLEMMLVPQAMIPAVQALLRPHDDDDLPAFVSQPDDDDHGSNLPRT